MRHWTLLDEAPIPGTEQCLALYKGKDDFSIKVSGKKTGYQELMNSRVHGSEDALGTLPCKRLRNPGEARVLIGGLGMGFTLAAALRELGSGAEATVAELIPQVVEWNRGPLGEFSGRPLDDPRVRVYVGDVAKLISESPACFDVIAMDVDNGPEGLTKGGNNWLYSDQGIAATRDALRPGGTVAYWSAGPDRDFKERLRRVGYRVEEVVARGNKNKGSRYVIWLASVDGRKRGRARAIR